MAYKPFKMKGHTLPGINQRSEGNTDLPDGRSGSSPFQDRRTWTAAEFQDVNKWGPKDDHNKKHKANPSWGEDHSGRLGKDFLKKEIIKGSKERKEKVKGETKSPTKDTREAKHLHHGEGKEWGHVHMKRVAHGSSAAVHNVKVNPKGEHLWKQDRKNQIEKDKEKKSPAKIAPLIAMAGKALIGSAVSGMMKKKENE